MSTRLLDVERTVKPKWTPMAIVLVDRFRCIRCKGTSTSRDTDSRRSSGEWAAAQRSRRPSPASNPVGGSFLRREDVA